jgi:hypothetical protein
LGDLILVEGIGERSSAKTVDIDLGFDQSARRLHGGLSGRIPVDMARAVEAKPDVPRHTRMYPTDFVTFQENASIFLFTRQQVVWSRPSLHRISEPHRAFHAQAA